MNTELQIIDQPINHRCSLSGVRLSPAPHRHIQELDIRSVLHARQFVGEMRERGRGRRRLHESTHACNSTAPTVTDIVWKINQHL